MHGAKHKIGPPMAMKTGYGLGELSLIKCDPCSRTYIQPKQHYELYYISVKYSNWRSSTINRVQVLQRETSAPETLSNTRLPAWLGMPPSCCARLTCFPNLVLTAPGRSGVVGRTALWARSGSSSGPLYSHVTSKKCFTPKLAIHIKSLRI